ncbi:MAG: hypothetical protein A3A82_01945 [Candidatus Pacebacteria bacterium RIFCSPLOWO2_01_FULL_47_12]|nr:MAG: hypothetical protein A3A82_01945 [Candidatus Pacebacteria bacterium RIFCSPLOWO2_01_FULL_47_12]
MPFISTTGSFEFGNVGLQDSSDVVILEKICKALRDSHATDFVKKVFICHYKNFFDKNYTERILNDTFSQFISSQESEISITKLRNVLIDLSKSVYSTKKNKRFFKSYQAYKSTIKPNYYYSIVSEDIIGNKILDFGSGNGYLSKIFQVNKYSIINTDILDYSKVNSKLIPFIKLADVSDIRKKIPKVDTIVVITVLHHINRSQLDPILKELSQLTKRIIVIEDIINPEFFRNQSVKQSALVNELLLLSTESRNHAINLTDFYGNVVAQKLTSMKLPFEFKTLNNWCEIFEKNGFIVRNLKELGFPKTSFHGFYQAKIVCDSKHFFAV